MLRLCDAFGVPLTDIVNPPEKEPVKPPVTDEDIKFALWGDDAAEITDKQLAEVRSFAAFIKERDAKR